jgi:hypothetical protein
MSKLWNWLTGSDGKTGPSLGIPAKPVYSTDEHRKRFHELYEAWPVNTTDKCLALTADTVKFLSKNFPRHVAYFQSFKDDHKFQFLDGIIVDFLVDENIGFASKPDTSDRGILDIYIKDLSDHSRIYKAQEALAVIFTGIFNSLPLPGRSNLYVPMKDLIPDYPLLINYIMLHSSKAFPNFAQTMMNNVNRISGITDEKSKRAQIGPTEYDGDPTEYLRDTCLADFFNIQLPFAIPDEVKFAHTWVVAGTGHGKTTLLTSMICDNIPKVVAGKASIVLMDSQSALIPQLERLKVWEGSDRLIVIDPSEPIAFSLFDAPKDQLNAALEMVHFVFAKLTDGQMTYRQDNLFNYLSEFLITAVPNATIHDFRDLLDQRKAPSYDKYKQYASDEVRDYLDTDFVKEKFTVDARNQVLTRLRAMLREPAFAKMFGAPKTKLDLFNELERGVCILIRPDKNKLGEDGTRLFGRFWIAQMRRISIQRQQTTKKTPTFFYIDECQDYLRGGDPKLEGILEQARKEHIGVTLLHHYGDQLKSTELVQLLGANTATKICGSPADADLARFSKYLQCSPDFILSQPKKKSFACGVTGMGDAPLIRISLQFPYIDLTKEPRMSEQAHRAMCQENIRKYGAETHEAPSKPAPEYPPDIEKALDTITAFAKDAVREQMPELAKEVGLKDKDKPGDDGLTTPGAGGWKK